MKQTRGQLALMLNRQLAALQDLHSQVKQAHWTIRGRFFYARHELFDGIASRLLAMVDDVAERIGALGYYSEGTMRMAASQSYLAPWDRDAIDGQAQIRALVERFAQVERELRPIVPYADSKLEDPITADLVTEMLRTLEKDLWFLESHLEHDKGAVRPMVLPHPSQEAHAKSVAEA